MLLLYSQAYAQSYTCFQAPDGVAFFKKHFSSSIFCSWIAGSRKEVDFPLTHRLCPACEYVCRKCLCEEHVGFLHQYPCLVMQIMQCKVGSRRSNSNTELSKVLLHYMTLYTCESLHLALLNWSFVCGELVSSCRERTK
eukprot:scpid63021/ scgid12534/ 